MRPASVLALVAIALPLRAGAADVPVAGRKLALRASARDRRAVIVIRDAAVAPPLADPRHRSALLVNGGPDAGQCRAEVALDPTKWEQRGRNWRYRAGPPGTDGVQRIDVRPGRIVVAARGVAWPCDLGAASQRAPVSVVLRVDDVRYCASFGGVLRNEAGRLVARDAAAPAGCAKRDLTVADLNVLHGVTCPAGTDSCRVADRIDLLFQWIVAAGCPDVVTLQEISTDIAALVAARLPGPCPTAYERVYFPTVGIDDEIVLARHPVVASESHRLYKNFRHVTFARLDHPLGPVDVFTTHLASRSDGAQNPCGADCPSECVAAGATNVRECQGVQLGAYVGERHDVAPPAVVAGDFNEAPGSAVYTRLAALGWIDTYLAAGNPECDAATGIGCTSGRVDNDLSQLESPASNENERIDYVFAVPARPGSVCETTLDSGTDADGDGTATRLFADAPNPFAPTCGPLPAAICWPSDHVGVQLDLDCG
jgi:endonuclease/exonuclease/phosphatase family metal-dependent hydrolase